MSFLIPDSFSVLGVFIFIGISLLRLLIMFAVGFIVYRKSRGTKWAYPVKIIGVPFMIFGYVYDVFLNYSVAALLFWDFAKEPTISERFNRYISHDIGWRYRVAKISCRVLSKFDPGHCERLSHHSNFMSIFKR